MSHVPLEMHAPQAHLLRLSTGGRRYLTLWVSCVDYPLIPLQAKISKKDMLSKRPIHRTFAAKPLELQEQLELK